MMRAPEGLPRFIHMTAVGALLAADVTVALAILAINLSTYVHDPRSLSLLIWTPLILAALATVLLTLAAGLAGAVGATRGQRRQWATSFRVLMALAVITPLLFAISHDSLKPYVFFPAVGLVYLVLPVLALLFIGRRTSIRLIVIAAYVAYGVTVVAVVLWFRYPEFGRDPNQSYTFGLYLPPQFSVAATMLVAATLYSMAGGIACAIDGRLSGHRLWSRAFLLVVVAGLIGPISLAVETQWHRSFSPPLEAILYFSAGVAYLALPIMGLVYVWRLRPPAAPPGIGVPGVSTSL